MWNTCLGLHDIYIDAHDFYKWGKKEEENSTIKFLFLSVDDYERSLSFLSEACNGIKSVDGSLKLHAAFPSTPNKLWVRNTSWGTLCVVPIPAETNRDCGAIFKRKFCAS